MTLSVVVIGTGPAAVSAARPLVERGLSVTFVDAGLSGAKAATHMRAPLSELRARDDGWKHLLGEDFRGMEWQPAVSPKLRMADDPAGFTEFAALNRIETDDFIAVGRAGAGGLSSVWGAVTFAYDDADMAGWPIGRRELALHYRSVSSRIGISGPANTVLDREEAQPLELQEPLLLSDLERGLLAKSKQHAQAADFALGRTRMAVLTSARDGRSACTLDNACLIGCDKGSIYNAAYDFERLRAQANVTLRDGFVAERIDRADGRWSVKMRHRLSGERQELLADKVVLAAGALASARLGMAAAKIAAPLRIENSPAVAFAMLVPRMLGTALPASAFGLAQLAFSQRIDGSDPADEMLGLLYPAVSMPVAEFLFRAPATVRGGLALFKQMYPALLIGLAYLPGRYSDNTVSLVEGSGGIPALRIRGGFSPAFDGRMKQHIRRLRRNLFRLGGVLLPGSVQVYRPGAEVHYGGPLGHGIHTDVNGALHGMAGLHIVDGAVLPGMPARNPTLTIMANAERIGTVLASAI